MKYVLVTLLSFCAFAARAESVVCLSGAESISYDGEKFLQTPLKGAATGKATPLKMAGNLKLIETDNETYQTFRYPLQDGRSITIEWSLPPAREILQPNARGNAVLLKIWSDDGVTVLGQYKDCSWR